MLAAMRQSANATEKTATPSGISPAAGASASAYGTAKARPSGKRDAKAGMTLIVVLLYFVIIASLVVSVQRTVLAQARVLDWITDAHREEMAELSLRAHLVPLVLESMVASDLREKGPVPLNGRAVEMSVDGRDWTVEVQAVSGVPNLLSTPLSVLEKLLGKGNFPPVERARYLSEPLMTLSVAQFFSTDMPIRLTGSPKLNVNNISNVLIDESRHLPRSSTSSNSVFDVDFTFYSK